MQFFCYLILPIVYLNEVLAQHHHNNHNRFQQPPPRTEEPFQIDPALEHEYRELTKRSQNSHYEMVRKND